MQRARRRHQQRRARCKSQPARRFIWRRSDGGALRSRRADQPILAERNRSGRWCPRPPGIPLRRVYGVSSTEAAAGIPNHRCGTSRARQADTSHGDHALSPERDRDHRRGLDVYLRDRGAGRTAAQRANDPLVVLDGDDAGTSRARISPPLYLSFPRAVCLSRDRAYWNCAPAHNPQRGRRRRRGVHARRRLRGNVSDGAVVHRRPLCGALGHRFQFRHRVRAPGRHAAPVSRGNSRDAIRDARLVRHRSRRVDSPGFTAWRSRAAATPTFTNTMKLSRQWLSATRAILDDIEGSQLPAIQRAAELMADSIAADRWVHTFGCGHATIPIEEMYPRIGGFVGFHPMIELPLTFFTRITGEMGIHQFLFLERAEGYGNAIMKSYTFDPRDTMWIFSHTGINNVNIDVALRAKEQGMRVIATGSAAAVAKSRH